jgi:Domain of unknown function (DUF222)
MEREGFSNDQVDQVLGQLFSGVAVFYAEICEWLTDADLSQQFLADGARDLAQWVSARFGLRHSTAAQLVRVARRLQDLPLLRERFAAGELSLDQTDAISRLATPETEEQVIADCLGLSNAALDRAARRAHPPSTGDELEVWRVRWLSIQYIQDGIRGHLDADLPGAEMTLVELELRRRADRIPVNPESGVFDPYPQRMADGLVELCATTGDENTPGPAHIVVHADLDALTEDPGTTGVAETESGPVIANETARRLSCDPIVECRVYDHARTFGDRSSFPAHPILAASPTLVSGWRVSFPRLWNQEFRPRPSSDSLGRRRTHRSGQSDPLMRVPPPVRSRARVEHP